MLFGCLFTAGDGSQACKEMERRRSRLPPADRQAESASDDQSILRHLLCRRTDTAFAPAAPSERKTSPLCATDVSRLTAEQNAHFFWMNLRRRSSLSVQPGGLKGGN